MALLVLLPPPRASAGVRDTAEALPAAVALTGAQAGALDGDAVAALGAWAGWSWAWQGSEGDAARSGHGGPTQWPAANETVLALPPELCTWHRLVLPKAPAGRLRAALGGLLEDTLLDDEADLHLALAPDATPGEPAWVVATPRAPLQALLAQVEGAGREVGRVVPLLMPALDGAAPQAVFHVGGTAGDEHAPLQLDLSHGDGCTTLHAQGSLARALLARLGDTPACKATPAAVAAAEHWWGQPVAVVTEAERLLQAAGAVGGRVNLRQFDLAVRHRGLRWLRDGAQRLMTPEWRWVRRGALAVVVLNLVGLNVLAWQQGRAVAAQKAALTDLLKQTYPNVRAVLDAPLQMRTETERLRAAAGKPGEADLEALMAAAAAAWPDGQGPAQQLQFEPGRLLVGATGWPEAQLNQFRDRLRAQGLQVDVAEGRVQLSRASR